MGPGRIAIADSGGRAISEQNAVFCSRLLSPVNHVCSLFLAKLASTRSMTQSLLDSSGHRKYLVAGERIAFVRAASDEGGEVGAFCLTLAITGARISEVLALSADRIDAADEAVIFKTLKQRGKTIFRAVPIPSSLIRVLTAQGAAESERLWSWGRTHAWKLVKARMRAAGIRDDLCKPIALRHAFAVEAGQNGIPLNIVQRWLGHARIETTAIYASALGEEERNLARRAWSRLEPVISPTAQS